MKFYTVFISCTRFSIYSLLRLLQGILADAALPPQVVG